MGIVTRINEFSFLISLTARSCTRSTISLASFVMRPIQHVKVSRRSFSSKWVYLVGPENIDLHQKDHVLLRRLYFEKTLLFHV